MMLVQMRVPVYSVQEGGNRNRRRHGPLCYVLESSPSSTNEEEAKENKTYDKRGLIGAAGL